MEQVLNRLDKHLAETDAQLAKADQGRGEVITPILFEEADGVWINMQGKDRSKKKRKCEMKIRILNGDGSGWIKGGLIDADVHFQLDPFHKNREITRKVKEEETEKKKLMELYGYFSSNKEGLIPYQKASWSKAGAENMGRLLCKKVCGNLYDTITTLSRTVLQERYIETIEEVLSSAKAPKKDGRDYLYPVRGNRPFTEAIKTNGRKAILNMLSDRSGSDLIYR